MLFCNQEITLPTTNNDFFYEVDSKLDGVGPVDNRPSTD